MEEESEVLGFQEVWWRRLEKLEMRQESFCRVFFQFKKIVSVHHHK